MHTNEQLFYAHSKNGCSCSEWEPLYGPDSHSERIVKWLTSFSPTFSSDIEEKVAPYLSIMGKVHDMGKASSAFQKYLKDSADGKLIQSVNHKTAGAKWAMDHCGQMGKLMAYALYGHHSGLPRGVSLFEVIRDYSCPPEVLEALPKIDKSPYVHPGLAVGCETKQEIAYQLMMAVRMLHSCLIDADWLATEEFCTPETSELRMGAHRANISELSGKLETYLSNRESKSNGKIAELRREIHHACYASAQKMPSVFRLNVPTGGGKTLSSLSFALAHARHYGLSRVIYVIPYTSIIEQTAEVFREVLGAENVVEHHCNIDAENDSDENRMAVENWDAPVIVTTAVQFFESLFASGNKQCRKIHNVGRSVVIFDEAQCLPSDLLSPCIYAMKALHRLCGCSLVLCTATQPAFEFREKLFEIGWRPEELISLIGEPMERKLAQEMKRVQVEELGRMTKVELLEHFSANGCSSALFIVNLTRQASELFELFSKSGYEDVYHLSARMCAAHRSDVLNRVKEKLTQGKPIILVATRVVEAGVDISFPVVYRDACGLDSLAQAAGRCNRNGETVVGQVYSYTDSESKIPAQMDELRDSIYASGDVIEPMPDCDAFHHERIKRYFQLFYSKRKIATNKWDKRAIGEKVGSCANMLEVWDFPEIASNFKLISNGQRAVIVCYGNDFETLRNRLMYLDRLGILPSRQDYRLLQQYAVNVYDAEWLRMCPFMERVHSKADVWMLCSSEYYNQDTGLLREVEELSYIC